MNTTILAVTNQKGGVGKTTTAVSVAAALAEGGREVLLIDMDPQSNATVACGVDKRKVSRSVMDVMLGKAAPEEVCIYCEGARISLLPANDDLTGSDEELARDRRRHALLKTHCTGWLERFEWVLIDCPPTLNLLTVNAMVAADYVLVPIQCEYFALEGVSALLDTIGQVRQTVNPALRVAGFIRTMFDQRSRLTHEVSDNLITHLKGLVFEAIVPRNVRLAEAPGYGMPIIQYDSSSSGAKAYRQIARELLERLAQ